MCVGRVDEVLGEGHACGGWNASRERLETRGAGGAVRTGVGDDVGGVAMVDEAFGVVEHAGTPADVTQDDDRDGL